MPELPEVETKRHYADEYTLEQTIIDIEVRTEKILEFTTEKDLKSNMIDQTFIGTDRHGKYLFLKLSNGKVVPMHFGMSGDLQYFENLKDDHKHDRFLISFENNKFLAFINQMKLGKISLAESLKKFVEKKELGPDALEIEQDKFVNMLSNKRGSLKYTLMKQQYIAGLGNIYCDEILFQERLDPRTKANQLDDDMIISLYRTMRSVLTTAIDNDAKISSYPDSYLLPRRNEKEEGICPRCNNFFTVTKVSGRTTVLCSNCQKKL